MKRGRWHLYFWLLVLVVDPSAGRLLAQEAEAPFGLTWGASVEEVKPLGVDLREYKEESNAYGESYLASKLPKAISGQQSTYLSFGLNNKLWRIVVASTPFENDPYGLAAKARYEELSNVLTEKYGKGSTVEQLGEGYYSEPKNFVYGIKQGESRWATKFDTPTMSITLALFAQDMSSLQWVLIYQNKALDAIFEKDQKAREKGSL
jgi:hypothetical protein